MKSVLIFIALQIVYLPAHATATGACANYPSNDKSFITLSWQSKEVSFNFTMHFVIVKGKNLQVTSSPRWAAANLTFSMKGRGLSGMTAYQLIVTQRKISRPLQKIL